MKIKYLAIAFGAIAMSACGSGDDSTDKAVAQTDQTDALPLVEVDVAHEREVPQIKSYTATVEADNVNNIAPATPNRIKNITVEVGDRVHRGQVLVRLDAANSDQLRINMEQIEREYNRALQLLNIGAGTQQSVDQLKAQFDAARTQYDNVMENTILTSPINGVVTARNYDPGDMSGSQPVLTVGQLTPIVKVMLNISENDMIRVATGMPVDVTFDAMPQETFAGKIVRIYPTVDTATRTFIAEANITNRGEKIKPGMFARVSINLGSMNNVVVPDRAIVKQVGSGNKYVYVLSNGKVSYHLVELGQRIGDSYELLSGIANGDTVVISGQTRLTNGARADILKK